MNRFLSVLAAVLLAGCFSNATKTADPEMRIRIANSGREPLQCRMMFGHWVDRDLGVAPVGGGTSTMISVTVQQQPQDGALYIMRDDGQRRMMVENIFCAQKDNWQATVGQIDLAVVRRQHPNKATEARVSCGLPESGGRVTCVEPKLLYVVE